jgi:hypothetical protein
MLKYRCTKDKGSNIYTKKYKLSSQNHCQSKSILHVFFQQIIVHIIKLLTILLKKVKD